MIFLYSSSYLAGFSLSAGSQSRSGAGFCRKSCSLWYFMPKQSLQMETSGQIIHWYLPSYMSLLLQHLQVKPFYSVAFYAAAAADVAEPEVCPTAFWTSALASVSFAFFLSLNFLVLALRTSIALGPQFVLQSGQLMGWPFF